MPSSYGTPRSPGGYKAMDYIYVLFDCKGHVIACCTDEFLADQFTYSRGSIGSR